ncbi:MAG: NUDIX domain-containing protein [Halioglobus sp.]|nr:NUDIX domain-containing protein [Halioglobus sp.]
MDTMSAPLPEMNFCPDCGGPLLQHVVAGEQRNHWFCHRCQVPHHAYPRVVVTAFVACGKRLLWVQRDLPPQRGKWAIPGGFLEQEETLAEGAARELYEEAGVRLSPDQMQLYMIGSITFINQMYVGFRATVASQACHPGVESMTCQFFSREECPWEEVAYPQVNDSIRQAYDDLDSGRFEVWQAQMTGSHYELRPVSQKR